MSSNTYDLSLKPPQRSTRIVEELQARDSQPEIQDIVSMVELDPVTSAHLLRQVNSPIFKLRQSVSTVDRAVTMLGFDAVANSVFIETHADQPEGVNTVIAKLAYANILKVSVIASLIADNLAHECKFDQPAVIKTAALLHQLGRMALLSTDPVTYASLWRKSATPAGEPTVIPPGIGREIVHFRTDYTRLGAKIAREWKYPDHLVDILRHHTDPERGDTSEQFDVVAVAISQFAARTLFEDGEDLERDQTDQRVESVTKTFLKERNMSRKQLNELLEEAKRSAFAEVNGIDL